MISRSDDAYQNLNVYFGDIHNHCGLSYANGSYEDAIKNAHLQLDFASVTLHAVWPDIPEDDPDLDYLVEYHHAGFKKAFKNWEGYLKQVEAANQPGRFITFPSYEWHSNQYGDHCIYYKNGLGMPILESPDIASLRKALSGLTTPSFLIPHHIAYKQGFRGINWAAFSDEFSPVAEIFSFHGLSESSEGPYPYLHTMGPRNYKSTAQHGWAQGYVFGVIGSTDHHNAHPGSYGSGRLGLWANTLTRDAIWEAIENRRTYALTGDKIALTFSLNGAPMGEIIPHSENRHVKASVSGGDSIDYIELLHNNQLVHRVCPIPENEAGNRYKLYLELGWGEKPEATHWDVKLEIFDGIIVEVEPRFRGYGAQGKPLDDNYAYSNWEQLGDNQVHLVTQTTPNPSLHTPATEGMSLEIDGNENTKIISLINGIRYEHSLSELKKGSTTHYLGGFVSPAVCIHRAVPQSEYQQHFEFNHRFVSDKRDWYYVRVRQKNNQWAWSSPIWVDPC